MEISTVPKGAHYYLSNKHLFSMRNDNGACINKWMGIWEGDKKLVDSFGYSVRIDDDSYELYNNCYKTVYRGYEAEHHYKLGGVNVVETSFISSERKVLVSALTFTNNYPQSKVITINYSVNVNTRDYGENWHSTEYASSLDAYDMHVHVQSPRGDVLYGTKKSSNLLVNFHKNGAYNEYDSDGARQRNYSAGAYTVQLDIKPGESVTVPFFIAGSITGLNKVLVSYVDSKNDFEQEREKLLKLQEKLYKTYQLKAGSELEKLCMWVLNSLKLLKHKDAVFAGLPWFTQQWARDSFWSFRGMLSAGDFETAEGILKTFAQKTDDRGVPNLVKTDGSTNYDSLDATTLYIISLLDYLNYTGDFQFLRTNRQQVTKLVSWMENNYDNGLLKEDEGKSLTWMDTLKRYKGIEIEALNAAALKSLATILSVLGIEKSKDFAQKYEQAKQSVDEYWISDRNYFADSKTSNSLTPNQLVPVIMDVTTREKERMVVEKMLESSMLSKRGLRTLSSNDTEYFAEAYHKGKAWGLTTNWLVTALFVNGISDKASEILSETYKNLYEQGLGCLNETFNPDLLEPRDASCQLWSSVPILSSIDEGFLGIRPELTKKRIIVSMNSLNGKVERFDKRIGDLLMDYSVTGMPEKQSVKMYFSKKPDFKVLLDFRNKQPSSLEINGEQNDSHEFEPGLENEITIKY